MTYQPYWQIDLKVGMAQEPDISDILQNDFLDLSMVDMKKLLAVILQMMELQP
jgi:hypothetical protein